MPGHAMVTDTGAASAGDRYRTLDMLRGVAAVIVVLFHEAEPHMYRLGGWYPRFSFLAVDLFFCLSGFVLAGNYDRRFAGDLTVVGFMRRRVRRLAPLYLIGWALGCLTLLIPGVRGDTRASPVAATLTLNLFLLPGTSPILFPLNPPGWSLFQELWVANLLYALLWRWLRPAFLVAIVAVAAGGLIFVAVYRHQGFDVGFGFSSLAGGSFRVVLSFFGGVLLSRLHARRPARVRVPAIALCAALVALLGMPVFTGRPVTIYQLFCIGVGFPTLIYFGASARERRPAIGVALGKASYAAYAIHWPLLGFVAWALRSGLVDAAPGLALQLALGALIILLSFGLHHLLDLRVRSQPPRGDSRVSAAAPPPAAAS